MNARCYNGDGYLIEFRNLTSFIKLFEAYLKSERV